MNSTSDEIRLRMLRSHTLWHRLWVDARLTTHLPETAVEHQQVWLDPTASRFRVLRGPDAGPAAKLVVANGQEVLTLDVASGQRQSQPESLVNIDLFDPPQTVTDTIAPHP
ncbi:MAG: hypothetical protein NTY23_05670, partial [Chloroflexi bacterium]|nr:hypothetical protein [Chloroflexota bacterium]